ncbi:Uu.00g071920.m01.CDS01 [Anthostomella pinea]|uniref:Uu.00g071920.m01.CDS01 n=1 Tax=Anthostomella pinea TaxID=933095 RepID=A0AAI8YLE4_9PEZI|nr:Uu.00g071920.m01.CDS01 [Anthostomella pinea]
MSTALLRFPFASQLLFEAIVELISDRHAGVEMNPTDLSSSTALPLMLLNGNIIDSDYAAFLQERDLDYVGENGSSGPVSAADEQPPSSIINHRVCQTQWEVLLIWRLAAKPDSALQSPGYAVLPALPATCTPHQPLDNESVWTHQVPCLSQNYEFLMHAILGLAASDLMDQDPSLVTFAMMHRLKAIKAIKAIKRALADVTEVNNTVEEGNALMVTCYALTFQGIVIVATRMLRADCSGARFLFRNIFGDAQLALLRPLMEALPLIDRDWTDRAAAAVGAMEPLCGGQVESEYHRLLSDVVEALYSFSFLAAGRMQMPHVHFQRLVDPNNQVSLLLGSHWIALQQIMGMITEVQRHTGAQGNGGKTGVSTWGSSDGFGTSTARSTRTIRCIIGGRCG